MVLHSKIANLKYSNFPTWFRSVKFLLGTKGTFSSNFGFEANRVRSECNTSATSVSRFTSSGDNTTGREIVNVTNRKYYRSGYEACNGRYLYVALCLIPTIFAKETDENDKNGEKGDTKTRREKFNFIADVVDQVIPSIVQIGLKQNTIYGQMDAASGSGFIVTTDGIILTNAHVVRNHISDIIVKLNDGRSINGRVIKIDKSADLAIIKIDCKDLKPVKLGDSSKVRTGEFVVALGSPLSLNNTVTSGVVSNPFRDGTELGLTNKLSYLQTDTIVTHGNSGGPLINLDGEVVGINTMTAAPGISFAIPSKYAGEFLDSRINSIGSKYRYLGMKMITLTPQIYYLFNSQPSSDIRLPENLNQGCLVVDVAPNSPAEKAGIRRGDVIVGERDRIIYKNADLFDILRKTPDLNLKIIREFREIQIRVKADDKEG